ncbi:389_t:CDS:2 [Rhizophagus irregularis]|nr:389_t:CDS:2 [Rhizophagus irregularis]
MSLKIPPTQQSTGEEYDVQDFHPQKVNSGYSSLENRGFSNITNITNITIEKETYEHNFIHKFKTKLNEEMGQYRKILDTKRKREIEEKAANI